MSRLDTLLLYALFASSFLVDVRLPLVGFSLANLAVPVAAVCLAARANVSPVAALRSHRRLVASALLVYVWTWISAANGLRPSLSLWYVVKYSAHLVVFFSLMLLLQRRSAIPTAQKVAYRVLLAAAVLGIAEYWFPAVPLFSAVRGESAVYPRVSSLFIWPNQFGVLMAIGVALGATLVRARGISAFSYAMALVPFLIGLALSGSRNGWLVLAVLLLALVVVRVVTLPVATAICAGLAAVLLTFPVPRAQLGLEAVRQGPLAELAPAARPAPGGTTVPRQTLGVRVELWRAALGEIEQHPISGIGLEVFANTIGPRITGQYWINTHNLFLNIATELGLVGLGLFGVFLFQLARSGDPRNWPASIPLLGTGVGQLFDCFIYDHAFMAFAVFFAACYASASRSEHSSSHEERIERRGAEALERTQSFTEARFGEVCRSASLPLRPSAVRLPFLVQRLEAAMRANERRTAAAVRSQS